MKSQAMTALPVNRTHRPATSVKLAAGTLAFIGYSLEEAVQGVAAAGYRYVELAAIDKYVEHLTDSDMHPAQAEAIRSLLERCGLETVAFAAHMDLASPGATVRFAKRMQFARDLGCRIVITNISPPADWIAFMTNLQHLAGLAGDLGLVIGLENPGNYLPAPEVYSDLLATMKGSPVAVNFDCGNVFNASFGAIQPLPRLQPLFPALVNLHIKDTSIVRDRLRSMPIGEGEVDYEAVFQHLAITGLPDLLTVEMPLGMEFDRQKRAYPPSPPLPWDTIVAALLRSKEYILRQLPQDGDHH
ncbi:MAG TPA: sugar phosphate isomerase/epimerase [Firmicutes bacterium]|nr:sugar phosphate isomerase/epimerase [Bacillota bacterium]